MSTACGGSLFSVRYPFGKRLNTNVKNEKDMDKSKICEALYALPGKVVVKRRKPVLISVALFAAGAAMIVANNIYGAELDVNLRSAVVFVGGALAVVGIVLTLVRLFGSDGAPFHSGDRCYLRYDELYFERADLDSVVRSVGEGAVQHLMKSGHARVPAVAVALYRTKDSRFAAMQAFEYADLEYRPLTELRIVEH